MYAETQGMSGFFAENDNSAAGQTPWENQPLGGDEGSGAGDALPPDNTAEPLSSEATTVPDGADASAAGQQGQSGSAVTDADRESAKAWGLTDAQIDAIPDKAVLKQIIDGFSAKLVAAGGQQRPNPQQQQQTAQPGQQQQQQMPTGDVLTQITPDAFKAKLSGHKDWNNLTEEAQGILEETNTHFATMLSSMAKAHYQELSQMYRAVTGLVAQQDHNYLRTMLTGMGGDDMKELVKPYLADNTEGYRLREEVRQMVMRMPNNVPLPNIIEAVMRGRHAAQLAEAQTKRKQEALRQNNSMLAAHAVGSGSTRRGNGVAARGRAAAVSAVTAIKERGA